VNAGAVAVRVGGEELPCVVEAVGEGDLRFALAVPVGGLLVPGLAELETDTVLVALDPQPARESVASNVASAMAIVRLIVRVSYSLLG
jgi:hypothetical protein